jgi:alanine racemase
VEAVVKAEAHGYGVVRAAPVMKQAHGFAVTSLVVS